MKAIETRYKGYHFRSRLEARWAVFFDSLGLKWAYEPEGFELGNAGNYLPDFKVKYPDAWDGWDDVWFEVKADLDKLTPTEEAKIKAFIKATESTVFVVEGPPDMRLYYKNSIAKGRPDEGWALWCSKHRLWWDYHDVFFAPQCSSDYGQQMLQTAVNAARSARFEYGQNGKT